MLLRNIVNMLEVDDALWLYTRLSLFFADHAKGTKCYNICILLYKGFTKSQLSKYDKILATIISRLYDMWLVTVLFFIVFIYLKFLIK